MTMTKNKLKIEYISASAGAGKTTKLINFVRLAVHEYNSRVIIVQPTHELLQQTLVDLTVSYNYEQPIIPQSSVTVIGSDAAGISTVQQAIDAINDVSIKVLLMTDKTAFRLSPVHFKNMIVLLDDVTTLTSTKEINVCDRDREILRDILNLKKHGDCFKYTIADLEGCSTYHDLGIKAYIPDIAYDDMYISGDVFDPSVKQVQLLFAFDPTKLAQAKSVIACRAHFESTLFYQCYKDVVDFAPCTELSAGIQVQDNYEQRLEVLYYTTDRYSSSWQNQHEDQLKKIIADAHARVGSKCLCACNASKIDLLNGTGWQIIKPCAEGLNRYTGFYAAVWLCSMLPNCKEVSIYQAVFGQHITADVIATARTYEQAYQCIMRTNLRVYSSNIKIVVIVPDFYTAKFLHPSPILIDGVVNTSAKKVGRPVLDVPVVLQNTLKIWRSRNKSAQDYLIKAKKIAQKYAIKYPDHIDYINNRLLGTQE